MKHRLVNLILSVTYMVTFFIVLLDLYYWRPN